MRISLIFPRILSYGIEPENIIPDMGDIDYPLGFLLAPTGLIAATSSSPYQNEAIRHGWYALAFYETNQALNLPQLLPQLLPFPK